MQRITHFIQGREVSHVCVPACKTDNFLALFGALDGAKLEGRTVYVNNLAIFLGILLRDTSKKRNRAVDEDLLDLPKEARRLERLTGNVQWEVICVDDRTKP